VLSGEVMPQRIARGAIFCRLANFIEGHAAVRPDLALAVASMLEVSLPTLPRAGHGAAGEMLLLSHLFGSLAAGMNLEEKEAGALVNGAPVAAALLADSALSSGPLLREMIDAVALAIQAFGAPLEAYDPILGELWHSPEAQRILASLSHALPARMSAPRSPQAPVSFRAAPRLLARALRSQAALRRAAENALGAVTDNPLVVGEGGTVRVVVNGGFFDADAPAIFDDVAGVAADLIRLLEKLATRIAETADVSALSRAAQARLRGLVWALAGYAEDAVATASRTPLPGTAGGGAPQNDLLSPVVQAWAKQSATFDLSSRAAATLRAVAACVAGDTHIDVQQLDLALRTRMASVNHAEEIGINDGQE